MANYSRPLTPEQQGLLAAARQARLDLEVAKRSRAATIDYRTNLERQRIALEVDEMIAEHDRAVDAAMLAAVDAGVPIRRIAFDAMGATHDASIRRMIHEALADRAAAHGDPIESVSGNSDHVLDHPQVERVLQEAQAAIGNPPMGGPRFTLVEREHVLYEDENERIAVATVKVELDPLDPWIAEIREFGRKGSEFLAETACTVYRNPGTGSIVAIESSEPGSTFYDHLAARWVKDHQDEAQSGYDAACAEVEPFSASVDA